MERFQGIKWVNLASKWGVGLLQGKRMVRKNVSGDPGLGKMVTEMRG